MRKQLLLSVSSDDKPGVVEKLSTAVQLCNGNWLESRLANLRGKFVGMIWVDLSEDHIEPLKSALRNLEQQGIQVSIDDSLSSTSQEKQTLLNFSMLGPDRSGIIKELSLALSSKGINLEELETELSSAPYSGDPIFEARGQLSAQEATSINQLKERLIAVADELGMDLDLGD